MTETSSQPFLPFTRPSIDEAAIADVTAFSIYMGFWFPEVERWIWVLAIIFFLAALNLLSVKVFGAAMAMSTILMAITATAIVLIERFRTPGLGEF